MSESEYITEEEFYKFKEDIKEILRRSAKVQQQMNDELHKLNLIQGFMVEMLGNSPYRGNNKKDTQ